MKLRSTEITENNNLDIVDLLLTKGFDATLAFFCTLFVFTVD